MFGAIYQEACKELLFIGISCSSLIK